MSFVDKMKQFLLEPDPDTDDPDLTDYGKEEGEVQAYSAAEGPGTVIKDSVISLFYPTRLTDAKTICDRVKSREAVIVDIEGLQGEQKQRLLDFLSGVILARDGEIMKLNGSIVLCVLANVKVLKNKKRSDTAK